jgi:ABC-type phosphate transport system substrate-binding protein
MDITARIMLGNITSWSDPVIVALNPGVPLPKANVGSLRVYKL